MLLRQYHLLGFHQAFLVTDLENDSHKELVILGSSGLSLIDSQANLIWLFHAKKNHEFLFIHIADINGDSSKEILLSDRGNRTTVLDAEGNLVYELNSKNGPIFVADFDHDEEQEIIIGPTIYDSNFNVKQRLPIASKEMKIDDLDNDGNQEIIVFYRKSNTYVSPTSIYVMNPMGEILWNYEYPTWINSYAIEDLDNDGFKEILVVGHNTSPITVFGKQ